MEEKKMRQIAEDLKNYKKAIENAEDALAEAERELAEELLIRSIEESMDAPDNTEQ